MKYFSHFLTAITLLFTFPSKAELTFLHIPKTAGVTLHTLLAPNFKGNEIYLNRIIVRPRRLSKMPQHRIDFIYSHPFVSGHLPFWAHKKNDPHFDERYIVTVLRDPVERVLSFWRYVNERRERSKREPLASPLEVDANGMCKMLTSDPDLTGDELLQSSIESLLRIDFIIFQDDFDNGVKKLFAKLNFPAPQEIPVLNTTKKEDVSAEVIEQIKELNALDIQLYEFAKQYLREKFREGRLEASLRETPEIEKQMMDLSNKTASDLQM